MPAAEPLASATALEGSAADRLASRALRGPLAAALGLLALGQLATWVPHYVTWPWFSDHDVFGTAAFAWDQGVKPYRDLAGNNFPGTTYVFWALGKAFGWGRTAPFYAFDAALVVSFGALMTVWSRRRFGLVLPGLIGYLTYLGYTLELDFSQAAQRDGQAPLLAVAGILLVETWPGRAGRACAAAAFASALIIRPQPVLLLPALVSALDEAVRPAGFPWTHTARTALRWAVLVSVLLAVLFAPLIASGLFFDFVRSVREAGYGRPYNRVSAGTVLTELFWQAFPFYRLLLPAAVVVLAAGPGVSPADRRCVRTWMIALAFVWLYRPLSPVHHAYLYHPLMLVMSIPPALLAGLALKSDRLAATGKVFAVLLALGFGATLKPRFSSPGGTVEAFESWWHGRPAAEAPRGYTKNPFVRLAARYEWEDYRDAMDYLRTKVPRTTRVANALKAVPAVNGPTVHLPAFPAESLAWVRVVRPTDEQRFADHLERTPDSVVVWSPIEEETDLYFPMEILTATIRRLYEPEARFGEIEVWKRRSNPEKSPAGG